MEMMEDGMILTIIKMSLEDKIIWWKKNYPIEFNILENAFGKNWIEENISLCIGATENTEYHRLGWMLFQSSEGNLEEVLLVAKYLSTFGSDKNISTLIIQLKDKDEYHPAFAHLSIAYQFHKAGWTITLEFNNSPYVVDFMATKSGEVIFVECSEKIISPSLPFENEKFMKFMARNVASNFGLVNVKIIVTGDDGSIQEAVSLIKQNSKLVRNCKDSIMISSENFRFEISITDKTFVSLHDERQKKSLAERLMDKINKEHKQTKSKLATRIVALQILGRPKQPDWDNTLEELHKRYSGRESKPDAILFFKKRWDGNHFFLNCLGFLAHNQKGVVLEETYDFIHRNDMLE